MRNSWRLLAPAGFGQVLPSVYFEFLGSVNWAMGDFSLVLSIAHADRVEIGEVGVINFDGLRAGQEACGDDPGNRVAVGRRQVEGRDGAVILPQGDDDALRAVA